MTRTRRISSVGRIKMHTKFGLGC